MLCFGSSKWRAHRPWAWSIILCTLIAVAGFAYECWSRGSIPGGSSRTGLVYGVLGGAIILFEFLLWPRKWPGVRAWRILGRTQAWMRAHLWLGLFSVPLITMHTGLTFGGPLSTWLTILFTVVIISGVWGLLMQQVIPRWLLTEIPSETIYSQIENLSEQFLQEADAVMDAVCGIHPRGDNTVERETAVEGKMFVLSEQFRQAGHVKGLVRQTWVPESGGSRNLFLRTAYEESIRPFLGGQAPSGTLLQDPIRARGFFDDLRGQLDETVRPAVDALENWCDTRRQFRHQQWLHWLLHGWLSVHLPLSIALVILMLVHAYGALKYW